MTWRVTPVPLRRGPLVYLARAPRAARREPAADRARRAAARAGPERDHGRDRRGQDRARARARPAAGRQAARRHRPAGRREAYVEGVFEPPAGLLDDDPSSPSCASASPRGRGRDRAGAARGRRGAHAGVRPGPLGHRRRPARAGRAAGGLLRPARAPEADASPRRSSTLLDGFCGRARSGCAAAARRRTPARVELARRARGAARARGRARARPRPARVRARGDRGSSTRASEERAALLAERERLRRIDALRAAAGGGRRGDRAGRRRGRGRGAARRGGAARRTPSRARTRSSTRSPSGCARCGSRPRTSAASCAATRRRSRPSPGGSRRSRSASTRYDRLRAQARRHGRGGARARRALPRRARAARAARRRRRRELEARARRGRAASATLRRRADGRAARGGAEAREGACSRSSPQLAMEDADVRGRARAARRGSGRPAPSGSSCCSRRTRACRPRRCARRASGGELSRVDAGADDASRRRGGARTLVFDEVDAGIGGQTARAVGERLRALAARRARSSASPTCRRSPRWPDATSGSRRAPPGRSPTAPSSALEGDAVVDELCRMLGADAATQGARGHAEELLAAA